MKHKHAELIKAWADGAEIEFYIEQENLWVKTETPGWMQDTKYRIKPEPKPDVVRYTTCEVEMEEYEPTNFKVNCDNLKLTFDGETGKLKSAEVIS